MGEIWTHMVNLTKLRPHSDLMQKFPDVDNGRNLDLNAKRKDKATNSRYYIIEIRREREREREGEGCVGGFGEAFGAGWFWQ